MVCFPSSFLSPWKTISRYVYVHDTCIIVVQNFVATIHWYHKRFFIILFHNVAGTERVVLGDLVYCKETETEKERGVGNAECEDEVCPDTFDSHDLDEISSTDLSDERNNLVKVCCSVLDL